MKISEMLDREDFYSILQATLEAYRSPLGFAADPVAVRVDKKDCTFYVNPKLNAIMAVRPGRAVKEYLQTEYRVGGSWQRRMAVKGYLWLAIHFVKPFAQCGIQITCNRDISNLLIYPCNKKIRVFDFGRDIVYTLLKQGFPDTYLLRETAFRQKQANRFIPSISETGNGFYAERIIHGRPLARIDDKALVEEKKREAYGLMWSLTPDIETVNAREYIRRLAEECAGLLRQKPSFTGGGEVQAVFHRLAEEIPSEEIPLVLSHGDMQPGNIWLEDGSDRIIIIDWETVKKRSAFYDWTALYLDMRKDKNKQRLYERILKSHTVTGVGGQNSAKTAGLVVLAEELAYQTEELVSFPESIGIEEYERIVEQYIHLKL